jgi:hypothetical protein
MEFPITAAGIGDHHNGTGPCTRYEVASMIVRNEGTMFSLSELEHPKEPLDVMTLAGPKATTWAMIGHRPVLHCGSGVSVLPLPEQSYPCWPMDELVGVKTVGV